MIFVFSLLSFFLLLSFSSFSDDSHESKADVADIDIMKHMIFHAIEATTEKNIPRNILLVSANKDFKCTLENLNVRSFKEIAGQKQWQNLLQPIWCLNYQVFNR